MKYQIRILILCIMSIVGVTACGSELSNENILIKQYKGLEVAKVPESGQITDQYVDNILESYRGRTLDTEGVAEEGDTVNINYEGKIDGEKIDGGTATNQELTIGSGAYIGARNQYEGFEEQITGHKAGETFDIKVQFPADYQQAEYSNKVAIFTITLNGIYPEISDEWVKEISENSNTVDEFRQEIRDNIEKYNQQREQEQLRSEVVEALVKQIEVKKLPIELEKEEQENIREFYNQSAKQYNVSLDTFIKNYLRMNEKEFNEKLKEMAKDSTVRKIACYLIADKHKLYPTDQELKKMTEEFANQRGYDDVKVFEKDYGEKAIRDIAIQQKVADYLVEKCVQVD